MTARRAIVLLDDGKEGELPLGDTLEGVGAFYSKQVITATSDSQTTFPVPGGFTPGFVLVFANGVEQLNFDDSDGLNIEFDSPGYDTGDVISTYAYTPFDVADAVSLAVFEAAMEELELTKQDLLVSGTNIRTVNGETLLDSGDLWIVTPEELELALASFPSSTFVDLPDNAAPWATEIEIYTIAGSLSANSNPVIQIGVDGGALITSGYASSIGLAFGTNQTAWASASNGLLIGLANSLGNTWTGLAKLRKLVTAGGNVTWHMSYAGNVTLTGGASGGGHISVSGNGNITKLRITTATGTDLFDAGQYAVVFKGVNKEP